ncbi:MAG: helix-turn-helix domain-containing protein [Actinobacteria bacterium]|nr:helix-turn-helix domain-containing protein [Actinomycetota bacterium]
MEKLLTVEQVAEILQVEKATAWRWCREGKIPAAKIGRLYRIKERDLSSWLAEKTVDYKVKDEESNG